MDATPSFGSIGWIDLTVAEASRVKDFYAAVVGWSVTEVAVSDYSDFCVHAAPGEPPVAGICHARGSNVGLPAQWLLYVRVPNLEGSLREVEARGGKVIRSTQAPGYGDIAIVEDPAGAVMALIQPR